ncbi:hypothetical protein JZO70_06255 [Enterococcus sp. 669A]|uniref:Uncharacterized protein n=1 Tax=Candidatus Enterococcus moelleringii TaxID=2815325 RepID=A0ABS3L800_9ENTE|nr:hypothetical protein [Enterococcus sp. 669A]MBO1305751.1 hypothetical protein [Enterococcus sp. 669A]
MIYLLLLLLGLVILAHSFLIISLMKANQRLEGRIRSLSRVVGKKPRPVNQAQGHARKGPVKSRNQGR